MLPTQLAKVEFARRLRAARAAAGFDTACSLAQRIGIEQNRYTRYERAEVEPNLDTLRRLCAALGVSSSDLIGI